MMSTPKISWPRKALAPSALVAAVLLGGGCAPGAAMDEDPTESAAYAALDATDGTEAIGPDGGMAGSMLGGMGGAGMGPGAGGPMMLCDASPEVTTTDVCGHPFVTTAQFSWSDCTLGRGSSSGAVDLTATVTAGDAACDASTVFTFARQSSFDVTRTRMDGATMQATGTSSSTESHTLLPAAFTRTTTIDSTRTLRDTSGNVVRSAHVTGTLEVALDLSTLPPARTLDGSMTLALGDDTTGTVELTAVVRPSPFVCRFPISGTVVRTMADGTVHTLVYGPTCGQATLDGNAIDLWRRGNGGQGSCIGG